MASIRWNNFSSGEIDPKIYGRPEIERTAAGVRSMLNMFPTIQGSAVKRPGFEYLGMVPHPTEAARLIPFQFNVTQQYGLLLQDSIAYILKDGGFVLIPDTDATQYPSGEKELANTQIEGFSGYVEIDVSTTTALVHGLVADDVIYVGALPAAFEELSYRYYKVSATGLTTAVFRLEELDGTAVSIGVVTQAGSAEYGPLATIEDASFVFTETEIFDGDFDYAQSADEVYFVHPNHQPVVVTRTDHHLWTVTLFDATPAEPAVVDLIDTARPADPGGGNGINIKYGVTAINDDTGEESLVAEVTVPDAGGLTDEPTAGTPITLDWDKNTNAEKYYVYRAINGIFGLLGEARWVSGTQVTYDDDGTRVPLLEIGPPFEVRDSFDTADNYPGAVALFQQRIWFGRTNNKVNGIYSSRSGSFRSFAVDEVTVDSSPIAQVIASEGVHEIRFLLAQRDLVIMTDAGEWNFDKGESPAITPSSGLLAQGDWGTAKVKPLKVGNSILFVESSGRIVRDLGYSLQSDGLDGLDLSVSAEHLFEDAEIVDWCFARKPYRLVFIVLSNGTAVSLTYDKEQQVSGWARHSMAGKIESVMSIREGEVDNIYAVINRGPTDKRYVERMNMDEVTSSVRGRYLDSWQRRDPTVQNWVTVPPSNLLADEDDEYKVKLLIDETLLPVAEDSTSGEYWPVTLTKFNSHTETIMPWIMDETFVLEEDANPPSVVAGSTWYTVNRWIGGHPIWSTKVRLTMELFPVTDKPRRPGAPGLIGVSAPCYLRFGSGEFKWIHSLPDADDPVMGASTHPIFKLDDETWDPGSPSAWEVTSINSGFAYANVIYGYPFTAELETMEVDSVEEPFDGSNVRAPEATVRLHQAGPFKLARSAQTMDPFTVDVRRDLRYMNRQTWLFEKGVIRQALLSVWDPRSSLLLRSDEPFPLSVQAIKLEAAIGDT